MYRVITLTILMSVLFSCGKDPVTSTPPADGCKLKTVNFDTSQSGAFNVKYDGDLIVQLTRESDSQHKIVFGFDSLNRFAKRETFGPFNGSQILTGRSEYYYDQSGHFVKRLEYGQTYSGNTALGLSLQGIDSFTYSGSNISEMKNYSPFNGTNIYQGKTVFTWTNDDLSSLQEYDQRGQVYHSVNFTYDVSKENKFDSLFKGFYIQEPFEYGHSLEGVRRSKHILTQSVEQWNSSPPPLPRTSTYITTFNKNGYVKSIQETIGATTFYVFRFQYTCD